jgi:hypothetical protein
VLMSPSTSPPPTSPMGPVLITTSGSITTTTQDPCAF